MNSNSQLAMSSKTLWMGDIEPWMDENFISSLFSQTGLMEFIQELLLGRKLFETVIQVSPQVHFLTKGYGFIEFTSHEVAEQVLKLYNGLEIPGLKKNFRLNWGAHSGAMKTPITPTITAVPSKPVSNNEDFSVYLK